MKEKEKDVVGPPAARWKTKAKKKKNPPSPPPPPKKKSSASGVRAASPHWPSFFPETNTRDTKVKSPITEHVPIIEHFPIFSSFLNQIE